MPGRYPFPTAHGVVTPWLVALYACLGAVAPGIFAGLEQLVTLVTASRSGPEGAPMSYDNAWLQGVFEHLLPEAHLSVREEQLAMANYVETALETNRHLLAEAGVGTGKTFAYLIPAFAHHERTKAPILITTHTIALQEQLMQDVPKVAELLGINVEAMLAKGKEHYVCPARLARLLEHHPDAEGRRVAAWAEGTQTGDRREIPGVSEHLWQQINWTDRGPCGRHCSMTATCPSHAYRQRWQEARGILITNHHQFFADMAMRASGHHLFALPGAIIVDEAHAILEVAREVLGHRTTLQGLREAASAAEAQRGEGLPDLSSVVETFASRLAERVAWDPTGENDRLSLERDSALVQSATALLEGAMALEEELGALPTTPERTHASDRLHQAIAPLHGILRPEAHISWVEGREPVPELLESAPRDLSGILAARLFGRGVPVILTSATLSIEGDFSFFKRAVGLEHPLSCSVGSPYDYSRQARLYMPDDLPDPGRDPDAFYRAALDRLKSLLEATSGRSLVLFTNKRRAEEAFERLQHWGRFPIYHQERSTPELLERFRRETSSVLLGTAFWEGIDVPGETLSCVVIVKLPFPPVGDPILAAQEDMARQAGQDPFDAVLLPEMLFKLKQGAGRLIRRRSDRGVIAVLDPRAATRERYHQTVLESLPPAPRLDSLEAIRSFLGSP